MNEKVSKEEVANFLSQQNEWMNSTEADRLNTIESVWKRLWQIQPEQPEVDLSKAEDIVKILVVRYTERLQQRNEILENE